MSEVVFGTPRAAESSASPKRRSQVECVVVPPYGAPTGCILVGYENVGVGKQQKTRIQTTIVHYDSPKTDQRVMLTVVYIYIYVLWQVVLVLSC